MSMRSKVTHRETVSGRTNVAFMIRVLPGRRQLVFDCEALDYAVFETTRVLAQEVPFVVMNGVAISAWTIDLGSVSPEWIDSTAKVPLVLVVVRMHPDGFDIRQEHARAEVFEQAVPLPAS
jgi:hypothetical protein